MSERLRSRPASEAPRTNGPPQSTRLPDRRTRIADGGGPRFRGGASLDVILARIHALPVLSPAAVRVLEMADRECSSAREIVAAITSDVRFSWRILKAANASCYSLPRVVATVSEAVLMLGTEAFRDVVVVAAVRDLLMRDLPGYGLSAREMWAHSLACGTAAEIVAGITGYSNPTEAFIAGVLHDAGKVVLDEEMQDAAPYVHNLMDRDNCTFLEAERMTLGIEHCDVGGRILRHWGIPQHIVQAVALHHKPVVNRQTVPLAGYVHLGEVLCSMAGIGLGHEGLGIALETQVLTDFKLSEASLDVVISRLVDALAASAALLALPACA